MPLSKYPKCVVYFMYIKVKIYRFSLSSIVINYRNSELYITLTMETEISSETLVNIYLATRRNIPDDSHLKTKYHLPHTSRTSSSYF